MMPATAPYSHDEQGGGYVEEAGQGAREALCYSRLLSHDEHGDACYSSYSHDKHGGGYIEQAGQIAREALCHSRVC